MKFNQPILLKFAILAQILYSAIADSVCDEKTLIMELRQDIEDNGVLDCLRVIQPPHNYLETVDEKNKRIAAQWDSQCAFEADYNWMRQLKEIHGINNLVDDTGDIVERDFDDQADMCEIVRAALAAGKFSKVTTDLVNIPTKILDMIDCVGQPEQTEICAVTGSSYYQNDTWTILLDGLSMTVDNSPRFIVQPDQPKQQQLPDASASASDLKKLEQKQLQSQEQQLRQQQIKVSPEDKTKLVSPQITASATLDSSNTWKGLQDMNIATNEAEESVVITSATFYDKLVNKFHFLFKFLLNGEVQQDSKAIKGDNLYMGLQSSFVSKLKKGENKIYVEYRSPGQLFNAGKNGPEQTQQSGRSIGALIFNKNTQFWKRTFDKPVIFQVSDRFTEHPNTLKFTTSQPGQVLVFFSYSLFGINKFTTQLALNNDQLKSSLSSGNTVNYVNGFGAAVQKVGQGDQVLKVQFINDQQMQFTPDDWQSFGLSALQLPASAKVTQKIINSKQFLTPGSWQSLDSLRIKLELETSKNIILYYQLSTKVGGQVLQTRVSLNQKDLPSTYSFGQEFDHTTTKSFTFLKLEKGKHDFNLEYKIAGNASVDPIDPSQGASMFIIELDV